VTISHQKIAELRHRKIDGSERLIHCQKTANEKEGPMLHRALLGFVFGVGLLSNALAQDVIILTGGTSGVYYPVGLALKRIFERDISNAKVTVLSTQATVENLNMLQQGKGVLALAQGDILNDAWKGNPEAGFPSSRTKIRLIGAAYPNYIHIIARRDANIRSVSDLPEKGFQLVPPAAGTS
jgi:uncharacterized protein